MLGLATKGDLELVEETLAEAVDEIGKLRHSLRLMSKKLQALEKDNKALMEMHVVKIEEAPKTKTATKTIKPKKKSTKKEVK